MSEMEFALFF